MMRTSVHQRDVNPARLGMLAQRRLAPASSSGQIGEARWRGQEGERRPRPASDRRRGAAARRRRSARRFAPATAWCRTPRAPLCGAGRHRARPGEHPPGAAVDLHRARYRRRQRVCRAGRIRAHHPRRAGAGPERSRARRRARPRDHPRHGKAHRQVRSRRARPCRWARPRRSSGNPALLEKAVTATYDNIVEKGFGRGEENESDEKGVVLANKVGYAPNGLSGVPDPTLKERNKDSTEKRGLFASHPGDAGAPRQHHQADRGEEARRRPRPSTDRYKKSSPTRRCRVTEIATVAAGSAGLTGEHRRRPEPKKEEPKKKGGFGLSKMMPTGGGEKQQAQVTGFGRRRAESIPRRTRRAAVTRTWLR